MIYSQPQVEAQLKSAGAGEERATLLKLEEEIRKAYNPIYAESFDGKEVERILTQLDLIRAQ
jgi:hypothetical protein